MFNAVFIYGRSNSYIGLSAREQFFKMGFRAWEKK
jgi:hypothetical protein